MKLTAGQLQRFDREGYLFFPDHFRPEEIKVLIDEVPSLYAQRRPERPRKGQRCGAHQFRCAPV